MSRIVTIINTITKEKTEYRIYTGEEEIEKAGIPYHKDFTSYPGKGEYVRSNNGLYIPITNHRTFLAKKQNLRNTDSTYHRWDFPRFNFTLFYSGRQKRLIEKHFIYPLDKILAGGNSEIQVNKNIGPRERFAAQLFVKEDFDLYQAFYMAYKGTKNVAYIAEIINKTLLSYRFVSYIKEIGGLEMLKDKLDEAGLDFKKVVKRLEEMVDNGDSNDAKWAIKTIGDFYDKEPVQLPSHTQNNINVGLLPQESKPNLIQDQLSPEKNLKQLKQEQEDS